MAPIGSQTNLEPIDLDPEFLRSRSEMLVILLLFLGSLVWTMGVSYAAGFPRGSLNPSEITLVWGIPSWVFWGILTPWLVIDVLAVWFCFFYMQDHCPPGPHETQAGTAQAGTASELDPLIKDYHGR